ncbi:MAG: cysteine hydrolase family protein [Lysobacter sp.]
MPIASSQPLALIIIDMINALDFPEGRSLLRHALPVSARIARLKTRCRRAGVPVIYANDNYGQWRSDFRDVVAICSHASVTGAPLAMALLPEQDDYFVLKPMHSGFFQTPLEALLQNLGTARLIVTGLAGDSCVLATAADARMRGFEVHVPADCTASISKPRNDRALSLLKDSLQIDTRPASRIRL